MHPRRRSVTPSASPSAYGDREVQLSGAELAAMPQVTEALPIACVEGWSASATWTGVRVRELLDLVEAPAGSDVRVESLQQRGAIPGDDAARRNFADDPPHSAGPATSTERPLAVDHGFPCRLIAPNRPGVLQTKWVTRLDVVR